MQRASDAGEPMITHRTTLKIDELSNPVPAFIMYMPVVRKADAVVYGYVLSPFRMPALMQDLLGNAGKRAVSLSIHDGLLQDPYPLCTPAFSCIWRQQFHCLWCGRQGRQSGAHRANYQLCARG